MRRTGIFLKRSGLFSVFSEVRCVKCSLFLVAIFFLLHSHIINRSVYVDVFLMICIVLMQFRHWPNWAWGCSLHHCTSRDGNLYISETLPQTQRGGTYFAKRTLPRFWYTYLHFWSHCLLFKCQSLEIFLEAQCSDFNCCMAFLEWGIIMITSPLTGKLQPILLAAQNRAVRHVWKCFFIVVSSNKYVANIFI